MGKYSTEKEAKDLEIKLIDKLESHISKNGYNLSLGGEGKAGLVPPNKLNLVGGRYGKLTVTEQLGSKNGDTLYKCICDCGNEATVGSNHLRTGHTISCGCIQREYFGKASYANNYTFYDNYCEGTLIDGKRFKIDLDVYDIVKDYHVVQQNGKSKFLVFRDCSNQKRIETKLDNLVLGYPSNNLKVRIIHKDGDVLNCMRSNLDVYIPDTANHTEYMNFLNIGIKYIRYENTRKKWIVGWKEHRPPNQITHIPNKQFNTLNEAIEHLKTYESQYGDSFFMLKKEE